MTEQLDVQQMAQRLLAADNILILCHKNPDGDTIGCGSALYYALKALEKTTWWSMHRSTWRACFFLAVHVQAAQHGCSRASSSPAL